MLEGLVQLLIPPATQDRLIMNMYPLSHTRPWTNQERYMGERRWGRLVEDCLREAFTEIFFNASLKLCGSSTV